MLLLQKYYKVTYPPPPLYSFEVGYVKDIHIFIFSQRGKEKEILDKKLKPAAALRILKMSKTEWHYLLVGSIGAALTGSYPFVFAILTGELLQVSEKIFILLCTCPLIK